MILSVGQQNTLFIYASAKIIIVSFLVILLIFAMRYKSNTKTNFKKMEVKTRFKIGDKVYLLDDRNIHSFTVKVY
jgi:hypothetical protein